MQFGRRTEASVVVRSRASSGVTPATVRVTVDPSAFQGLNGTSTVFVRIDSDTAENLQPTTCPVPPGTGPFPNACFRLLINNPNPDQRGTVVNVPGLLVDLLSDPARNRFYILRQDLNQVLVFDATNNAQIGVLRTGTTPMQMALTSDGKYLLVGHNNAQFISVFDLDSMQPSPSRASKCTSSLRWPAAPAAACSSIWPTCCATSSRRSSRTKPS